MTAKLSPTSFQNRYATASPKKAGGSHYTPRALADFVAKQICSRVPTGSPKLSILDPALGDGELVLALLSRLRFDETRAIHVHGFETDLQAIRRAESRLLLSYPKVTLHLHCGSFLDHVLDRCRKQESDLFSPQSREPIPVVFDVVIANPPYVRTQILGAERAQQLARQFHLSGRIDLYHAFLLAIAEVVVPAGLVGIIVSNRFMTTRAGLGIRRDIQRQFDIHHVWDLGDTKLFAAAVLPAVLLLQKKSTGVMAERPRFTSVYSSEAGETVQTCTDIVDALSLTGTVETATRQCFLVRHGRLESGSNGAGVWRLSTDKTESWIDTVRSHTCGTFRDLGKVRVGVKTTADKVFIRSDWNDLNADERPELLRPLVTHHVARRFRSLEGSSTEILYPHAVANGKRYVVPLSDYPNSARYLERHRRTLEARRYVTDSGREWYEIWVPQDPEAWQLPKLVFRDISGQPTFWIDVSGAVVNGDCYWIPCQDPQRLPLLWLALAVANTKFVEEFYDHCFCNKLYAGRRRYCTQYVEQFPLPDPKRPESHEMIRVAQQLYDTTATKTTAELEEQLNALVFRSFGLSGEEGAV